MPHEVADTTLTKCSRNNLGGLYK